MLTMPSASVISAPNASLGAAEIWAEIVARTLDACTLRREGRQQAAQTILNEQLPGLIQKWSRCCGIDNERQRQQLRQLFSQAQHAVASGWMQRKLIVEELLQRSGRATPRPAAVASGPLHLRRRVPFGDVAGMLDGLAEAEAESRLDSVLPARSVVPLAWQALEAART